ncbi:MAG: UDP-N-acetylglucosamine 2-epimerase (non-hydrolyzing) [Candidatus Aenigmatarchaeota archaeon]
MIAFILGTRAELIKTFTVMKELDKRNIPWVFIHTGQHNIEELRKEFEVKKPKIKLDFTEEKSGRFKGNLFKSVVKASVWNFKITRKLRNVISEIKPKVVLCQGDTMATAAAAIASRSIFLNRPLIGHIEAGIRTYDLFEPFPEEISRRITDKLSDLLFAPTIRAVKNLRREIKFGKIFLTGNTIVDAVNYIVKKRCEKPKKRKYVIAQIHRQENVNSYKRMKKFVDLITNLPYKVLLIVHSNTLYKLKEFGLWKELEKSNIEILDLMGYSKFIGYLKNSLGIITDSGGLAEECTILKKPCLIFREKTERPEAIEAGVATLVINKNIDFILNFLERKIRNTGNPFGKVGVSKKIVDIIEDYI